MPVNPLSSAESALANIHLPGNISLGSVEVGTEQFGGLGGGLASTVQTGQAVAGGFPAWIKDFISGNGIMRVGEGLLGLLLIAIGVGTLVKNNSPIAQATKFIRNPA